MFSYLFFKTFCKFINTTKHFRDIFFHELALKLLIFIQLQFSQFTPKF